MTTPKNGNIPQRTDDLTTHAETAPDAAVPTPARKSGPQSYNVQLPVVVGNRYKLLEIRGGGGMAKVYRATDQTLERDVAVKLINPDLRDDPEFDARFQREAKIASQLSDPHIVVVHDFGLDPQCGPYLVMEYLRGQSLRERLIAEGPLPLKAGLQLCAQVLLAMIHAHGKNIIHRDIKPDNVFILNQSGIRLHVRVLDYGIARILRGDNPSNVEQALTEPGAVMGTPRYMAPEQLAGQPADARSDLYSAAMVIHEALTGKLPYVTGKSMKELCPEASDDLCELIQQCLNPNPNARPATAVEVYLRILEFGKASGILLLPPGALEKLAAGKALDGSEDTVTYVPANKNKHAWWLWAGVGIAIGVVAGLLLWLLK
ncbi:MAG TPA: serine/threonine-protein kinase [Gemmataceae bacterium]|nr:serine/threonine-protein kinase [Gemmataceae bacterium]